MIIPATLACGDFWSACWAFLGAQGAGTSSLHGRKLLQDPQYPRGMGWGYLLGQTEVGGRGGSGVVSVDGVMFFNHPWRG